MKINKKLIPGFENLQFTLASNIEIDNDYTNTLVLNKLTNEVTLTMGVVGYNLVSGYNNILTLNEKYVPKGDVMVSAYSGVFDNGGVRVRSNGVISLFIPNALAVAGFRFQVKWVMKSNS